MRNGHVYRILNSDYLTIPIYLCTWIILFSLLADGDYIVYGLILGSIYSLMHFIEIRYRNHMALSADSTALPVLIISFAIMSYILVGGDLWQWPESSIKVGFLSCISLLCGHVAVLLYGFIIDKVFPSETKQAEREAPPEPITISQSQKIDLPFTVQTFHLLLKDGASEHPSYSYETIVDWFDDFYLYIFRQIENKEIENNGWPENDLGIAYKISNSISIERAILNFDEIPKEKAREMFQDWLAEFDKAQKLD